MTIEAKLAIISWASIGVALWLCFMIYVSAKRAKRIAHKKEID